ncbi:MAG: hypothetical protein RL204_2299 [Bacteroidota bacterium]
MWGGSVTYKYRVEDPRLGRFFSVDPLSAKYPWNSNYAFSENMVIHMVELEGLESAPTADKATVTDAGHGINGDSGAVTGCNGDPNSECVKEADLALKLEEATNCWLSEFGVENTRTRTGELNGISQNQVNYRVGVANGANANVLVSFHLDWEKGRKDVTILYQQPVEQSNTEVAYAQESKELAESIQNSLTLFGPTPERVLPVKGNTRFTTLGVLHRFNGDAAVLIEFGSVGDKNNVELINSRADDIGKEIATGIYFYLYGKAPESEGSDKTEEFSPEKIDITIDQDKTKVVLPPVIKQ